MSQEQTQNEENLTTQEEVSTPTENTETAAENAEAAAPELGLADAKWSEDQLLDFMVQHPILMNRPVVVTALGTALCRPSETVLTILPDAQRAAFRKEDGQAVVDAQGKPV